MSDAAGSDATPPDTTSADEIGRITAAAVPLQDRVRAALRSGDPEAADAALEELVERFRSLQDYSVNWITSLLTFIGERLGEEAVEDALRGFGEAYLRERRSPAEGAVAWADLPAEVRARALVRPMVANGATVAVESDEQAIRLSFRCGTGGRLVDEGRYRQPGEAGGRGYLVLRGDGPMTFGEPGLPVYCAHCSVNNELQPTEWDGAPVTVEFPTRRPGEPCVHLVRRDGRRGREVAGD